MVGVAAVVGVGGAAGAGRRCAAVLAGRGLVDVCVFMLKMQGCRLTEAAAVQCVALGVGCGV